MLQTVNDKKMLSQGAYDFTKKLAQLYLPAFGTLYVALSGIWGFPAGQQVSGTVLAVDLFLGACLGLSARNYDQSGAAHDGEIQVGTNSETGQTIYNFDNLKGDLADWADQKTVNLKVVPAAPTQPQTTAMDFSVPPEPPEPPVPSAN